MRRALAIAALLCASAQAQEPDATGAYSAFGADMASTAIGLSMPGIAEANPLGLLAIPLTVGVVEHAKTLPREQAQPILDTVAATRWGAAVSNLLVIAGAGPAAPLVGLAVGLAHWQAGEEERQFWQACAVHRADNPALRCEFKAAP